MLLRIGPHVCSFRILIMMALFSPAFLHGKNIVTASSHRKHQNFSPQRKQPENLFKNSLLITLRKILVIALVYSKKSNNNNNNNKHF
jgi:hypothetical protein